MPSRKRRLVEAFGHVVRETRIREELTQEQLSFRADVHRTYISDLERGLKSPTLDVIDSLTRALGTEPHVLLEAAARFREAEKGARISVRKRFRR